MNKSNIASLDETREFLSRRPGGILLNVLTPEHHERRHIPGSSQACVFETAFLDHLAALTSDKSIPILAYGAGESLDAATAAEKLLEAGYSDVSIFPGGIDEWRKAGLPLEGSAPEAWDDPFPQTLPRFSEYDLVAGESLIRWTGRNDSKSHWGSLPMKAGELVFANGKGSGWAVADMTAIKNDDLAGDPSLLGLLAHLASDDFFNSAKYPEARVHITELTPLENASWALPNFFAKGILNIKGREHEAEGEVALRNLSDGRLAMSGQINLDRTLFGVLYGSARFFSFLGMHKVDDLISLDARMIFRPR